jgi:hypothetical protein
VAAIFVNRSRKNSKLYRGPFIDVSYHVSLHFGHAVSEEKIVLIIDQSETRIACGGHVY